MKTFRVSALLTALSLVAIAAYEVNAATSIRVRCEQRANRSKVSVDGSNLVSGLYKAVVTSGANSSVRNPSYYWGRG